MADPSVAAEHAIFSPRLALQWIRDEPNRLRRSIDGAMVFLDVSGFTALSEMLQGLGRVGAEEITSVIDGSFERLLAHAYVEGGSLLKFGGDALLLFFEGDQVDASQRAARASHRMMRELLDANPVQTPAGSIDLSMTVGVHAGRFELLLVGHDHRELLVLGPDTSEVLRAESQAERGRVLVTTTVSATLGDATGPGPEPDLRELTEEPVAGPAPGLRLSTEPDVSASSLLSGPVARRITEGLDHGEHRRATIAFVHFGGTDALAAGAEHELADACDTLLRIVQAACAQHGACLLSSDVSEDGGKIILTSGVPYSHEDESDRVLRTVRAVVEQNLPLDVRIGIHRGPVFAGVVGPPYRRTFTILGDAVNTAARVMGHAKPGQVLSTPGALNQASTLFDVTEIEPFTAKGKAKPIRALVVGRETGIRLRSRPSTGSLVEQRQTLEHILQAVHDDPLGAIEITGPAGIGKSRLIDELQERHATVPFVLAVSSPGDTRVPLATLRQVARTIVAGKPQATNAEVATALERLSHSVDDIRDLTPLLGPALGLELPSTPQSDAISQDFRERVGARTLERILRLGYPGRLIVVIEDVQWIDTASSSWLELLLAPGSELDWTVIVTARDGPSFIKAARTTVTRIALGPLTDEGARQLVLEQADHQRLPFDRIGEIVERAHGNPLFLLELTHAAESAGELPDSLETMVHQRLDSLHRRDLSVLQQAAVLGGSFPVDLLRAVAGAGAVTRASLERLADFLQPSRDRLTFLQNVHQEVAYARLPHRDRVELHAKAAAALELRPGLLGRGEQLSHLARHHAQGEQPARAWEYAVQGAELAREQGSLQSSADLLRTAADMASVAALPADLIRRTQQDLGQALYTLGSYDQALTAFEATLAHADGHADPATARRIAVTHDRIGNHDASLAWFEQAAAMDDGSDPAEAALRDGHLAATLVRMGRVEDGLQVGRRVLAMDVDETARARGAFAVAWASVSASRDQAGDEVATALALVERAGDHEDHAHLLVSRGSVAYYAGRWADAVEDYDRAAELFTRLGDTPNAAAARMNIGEVRSDQGRLDEAVRTLRPALREFRAVRYQAATGYCQMLLGRTLSRQGAFPAAHDLLNEAQGTFTSMGAAEAVKDVTTHRVEALAFAADGDGIPQARAALAHEDDDVPTQRRAQLLRCLAVMLWRSDPASSEALTTADAAVEVAVGANATYEALLCTVVANRLKGAVTANGDNGLRQLGVVGSPDTLVFGPAAPS